MVNDKKTGDMNLSNDQEHTIVYTAENGIQYKVYKTPYVDNSYGFVAPIKRVSGNNTIHFDIGHGGHDRPYRSEYGCEELVNSEEFKYSIEEVKKTFTTNTPYSIIKEYNDEGLIREWAKNDKIDIFWYHRRAN